MKLRYSLRLLLFGIVYGFLHNWAPSFLRNNPKTWYLKVIAYDRVGKLSKRFAYLATAIQREETLRRKTFLDFFYLAVSFQLLGHLKKALTYYEQALKCNPDFVIAYGNRGNTYLRLGEYEKAIEDYTRAIELDPKLTEAYSNRGLSYREIGEYEQVINDHTKAIELNSEDVESYYDRGIAYEASGKEERAITDFITAWKLLDPLSDVIAPRSLLEPLSDIAFKVAVAIRDLVGKRLEFLDQLKTEKNPIIIDKWKEWIEYYFETCMMLVLHILGKKIPLDQEFLGVHAIEASNWIIYGQEICKDVQEIVDILLKKVFEEEWSEKLKRWRGTFSPLCKKLRTQ